MAEPFLGEIKMIGFNFAPRGWSYCDGQILPISQHQSLYSILGTIYGGDGRTTFALPDLRSRTPVHVGSGVRLGEKGGEEAVTLTVAHMPQHNHFAYVSAAPPNTSPPNEMIPANLEGVYADTTSGLVSMRSSTIAAAGGAQSHDNMQPYLTIGFCIALQGLFPSRS